MEIKPWEALMLKMVFEDAIHYNSEEAKFYEEQEGKDNKHAVEHAKKAKEYKMLRDELGL